MWKLWFWLIQYFQFDLWSLNKTLTWAAILGQSGPGSNDSKQVTGGARGVIVIVVGNGHGDTSSNPGRDW